jgi:AraC-like DNA-binding protein
VKLGSQRQENGFWAIQSLLFSMIDYLNEFEPDGKDKLILKNNKKPKLSEKINSYLHDNVENKLNLKKIARHFNMSISSLTHKYLCEENESIMQRFMSVRMSYAERLLFSGENISSIADKTGFCSMFNFSRTFKKHFGMSPVSYRKKQYF